MRQHQQRDFRRFSNDEVYDVGSRFEGQPWERGSRMHDNNEWSTRSQWEAMGYGPLGNPHSNPWATESYPHGFRAHEYWPRESWRGDGRMSPEYGPRGYEQGRRMSPEFWREASYRMGPDAGYRAYPESHPSLEPSWNEHPRGRGYDMRHWQAMPRGLGMLRRGPKGWKRTDERLYEHVCEAIECCFDIDASDVTVRVQNGEVFLEGTVPTRRDKHLAEYVSEEVIGVEDVHNHLRIKRDETAIGMNGESRSGIRPTGTDGKTRRESGAIA